MALTATATEVAGKWSVQLSASGSVGSVTWFRDVSQRITEVGTGTSVIDRTVPLNTEVYYEAVDDADSAVAGPITIASEYPVLSSSQSGAAHQVTVVAQQPQSWQARSVWHPILDRTDGPIVSIFDAEWRAGTLVLQLGTDRALRGNLIQMLMVGDPLIIRATCPERVDDLTFLPLDWTDPYIVDGQWGSGQRLEIRYQSVSAEPPAWVAPPEWTYGDVLISHAAYSDLLPVYPTYSDLLEGAA